MTQKQLLITIFTFIFSAFTFAGDIQNPSNQTSEKTDPFIIILVAILTVLGSGVVAAWVSHYLAKRKEELFYKRTKLEDLYKCIEGYTTLLFVMNHMWLNVMNGDIDFNTGLDMQINNKDDDNRKLLPEIDMLINLYFPKFLVGFKNLIEKRDNVNKLYLHFKSTYKSHGPTVDYSKNRKEFLKALLDIEEESKQLLHEVSKYAQTID